MEIESLLFSIVTDRIKATSREEIIRQYHTEITRIINALTMVKSVISKGITKLNPDLMLNPVKPGITATSPTKATRTKLSNIPKLI